MFTFSDLAHTEPGRIGDAARDGKAVGVASTRRDTQPTPALVQGTLAQPRAAASLRGDFRYTPARR